MWEGSVWLKARGMKAATLASVEITSGWSSRVSGLSVARAEPTGYTVKGAGVVWRPDIATIAGGKEGHARLLAGSQRALEMTLIFFF